VFFVAFVVKRIWLSETFVILGFRHG